MSQDHFKLLSRKEAIETGSKVYFTGKPCKHGHVSYRRTDRRNCVECAKLHNLRWKEKNPDYGKEWLSNNQERMKFLKKEWKINNKIHVSEYGRQYYFKNKETILAKGSEWSKSNRPKRNSYWSKYKAQKLKATPPWLTEDHISQMQDMYWLAKDCESVSGQKYHVDHIVPLQGENVCGLHVPWNLQVIPAELNLSKGNKLQEHLQ